MRAAAKNNYEVPTSEDHYPAVPVNFMKLAWESYTNGLQSPAPSEERRYQRAESRVRYAVRLDRRNQWNYVARCYAFANLIREIGEAGFGEWLQPGNPGFMVFHNAVWDAVASMPLRRADGCFGRIEFLAAVKKIAKDKSQEE